MKKLLIGITLLAYGLGMFAAGDWYANRNTIEYVRDASGKLVRK